MNTDTETTSPTDALVAAVVARMLQKVEAFNKDVVGLPIPSTPVPLSLNRAGWAATALGEELEEFIKASAEGDILETADALIDLVYFALGRLVEMGVPAMAVFDEVQRANMSKRRGELSKRPGAMGYDAVKPEGWQAPEHLRLIGFSLSDMELLDKLHAEAATREAISPVWLELQQLRESKGKDYNDVPGGRDAYFPFGHFSYAHMIHTKELRLQSLLGAMRSGRPVNHEGILDTVKDLVNYGTYYAEAIMSGKLPADTLAQPAEASA